MLDTEKSVETLPAETKKFSEKKTEPLSLQSENFLNSNSFLQ